MTIRKHRQWGEPGGLGPSGVVVHDDAEAAEVITHARRAGRPVPELGLLGGDLCATMGGTGSEENLYGPDARRYPVDLGTAVVAGERRYFVAHAVVRRRCWRGRIIAVMNAQYLGGWDLAPKSHPNDGLLDTSDATLSWSDKLAARKRAPSGTHIPHPGIVVRRTRSADFTVEPAGWLYLDGVRTTRVREVSFEIEPDALVVVI